MENFAVGYGYLRLVVQQFSSYIYEIYSTIFYCWLFVPKYNVLFSINYSSEPHENPAIS